MKKFLLIYGIVFFGFSTIKSQCAPSCSNYVMSSVTYSMFPTGGTNIGTSFVPNADDGITGIIPLGFNFNFYCGTYSSVIIGSNGFLTFDIVNSINASTTQVSTSIPNTSPINGFVAFNWDDLDPSAGGAVTYTTIGTSPNRIFILTYSNVPIWASTAINSGQIALFETSNTIEIHSALINTGTSYFGTQGIEDMTGSSGLAPSSWNNSLFTGTNTAYRFAKVIVGTPPTGISGTTTLCFNSTGTYTCNLMPGASSYSWIAPSGWTGTSTNNIITYTVGGSSNLSVTATYTCGTSAPGQFSVNVLPAPIISIPTATPGSICSGSIVTIVGGGGVNYTLLPGNISGPSPFTVAPTGNITYSLYGDDTNGCTSVNPALASIFVQQSPTVTVNSGSICLGSQFTLVPVGANSYTYSTLFSQVTPTAAGNYSYLVIGSANNGCLGTAVSSLTVNPLPTVLSSATRTTLCINETTTLTASGTTSYSWSTGATSASIVYSTAIPNVATILSVTGTSSAGCVKTSTLLLKVNSCTGINETLIQNKELEVYPNPSKNIFYVKKNSSVNETISIINALGQVIKKIEIIQGTSEINLENYPSGVYYLKADKNTSVVKLIKTE